MKINYLIKNSFLITSFLFAACSSDKITFPPEPTPPPSTAMTAKPYLSGDMYVCPMPVPVKKVDSEEAKKDAEKIIKTDPNTESVKDLSLALCNQGVVLYRNGSATHMVIPSDLLFYANRGTLKYSGRPVLNEAAALIVKMNSSGPISIGAFTDSILSSQQSYALSKVQANAVQVYFWGRGIPMDAMTSKGYGNLFRLGSEWTQAGNAANRRVEVNF